MQFRPILHTQGALPTTEGDFIVSLDGGLHVVTDDGTVSLGYLQIVQDSDSLSSQQKLYYKKGSNQLIYHTSGSDVPVNPQPDWSQSDVTSPSFVRNKPGDEGFVKKIQVTSDMISGDLQHRVITLSGNYILLSVETYSGQVIQVPSGCQEHSSSTTVLSLTEILAYANLANTSNIVYIYGAKPKTAGSTGMVTKISVDSSMISGTQVTLSDTILAMYLQDQSGNIIQVPSTAQTHSNGSTIIELSQVLAQYNKSSIQSGWSVYASAM